jgi:hypothetical protein
MSCGDRFFTDSCYDELHGAGTMLEPGDSNVGFNYINRFNHTNRLCLRRIHGDEV